MILPSEELLSEILDIEEGYIELARCDKDSTICYQYTRNANTEDESIEYHYVNIYELAHKVKEWAFRQGYYMSSGISFNTNLWWANATPKIGGETRLETFDADNEPEAIFQAGEWILKDITSKQNICG